MDVERNQWPVGQGAFATGRVAIADQTEEINYVYDCGARNVRSLEPVVAAYARRVSSVDALFVSHLDGDHVDGLDLLLARTSVSSVYLPYLSAGQRLLLLASAEDSDAHLTGSFIQAQFDPASWFGSRGVENIVFVRNTGEMPEGFIAPPPGDDDKTKFGLIDKTDAEYTGAALGNAATLEMEVGGYLAITSRRPGLLWILQPFVPKVDDGRIRQFEDKVRDKLRLTPNDAIDFELVRELLKSNYGRQDLRSCYDSILPDGSGAKHNEVSMSLFSGPSGNRYEWEVWQRFRHQQYAWHMTNAPGWIGTGDAKLKSRKYRKEWLDFYGVALNSVCSLLLPHHGSRHNFHSALLSPSNLRTCIASADERHEGYRHPSAEVVEEVEGAGLNLAHVTKQISSRCIEKISLAPANN